MISKKEMQIMIAEKVKEVENVERHFNQCSLEDFELANMRLTTIREELSKLIREARNIWDISSDGRTDAS